MIEFQWAVLLLLIPLAGGAVRLGWLEFTRIRCGLLAFRNARNELLLTAEPVTHVEPCGGGLEGRIRLLPLDRLDRTGRDSRYSEVFSFSWPSALEPDSGSPPDTFAPSRSDR